MVSQVRLPGAEESSQRLNTIFWDRLHNPATVKLLQRSLSAGIVLDAWMVGRREENFEQQAILAIELEVTRLTEQAIGKVFPAYRLSTKHLNSVFHELLSCTALFLAHQRKGTMEVAMAEAAGAIQALRGFIAAEPEGAAAAVHLYCLIASYENYGALVHYGRIMERDFRFGNLHRPWIRYTLDEELAVAQRLGHVMVRQPCPEGSCVQLTPEGRRAYEGLRQLLLESGEMAWRMEQQQLSLLNELDDYDEMADKVLVSEPANTLQFVDFAGISPGMQVLEVGSGSGRVTIDGGLFRRVLPGGRLVAVDPSPRMLALAQAKMLRQGIESVEFHQATAKTLPFPDATFDVTLGTLSLQPADAERMVREMVRVTKPGGRVVIYAGLQADAAAMPVLPRWFESIFNLAENLGMDRRAAGTLPGEVAGLLRKAGLDEVEVVPQQERVVATDAPSFLRFILAAGVFQEILEPLPYAERIRLLEELELAGEEICSRTTLDERTWHSRSELIRGTVAMAREK